MAEVQSASDLIASDQRSKHLLYAHPIRKPFHTFRDVRNACQTLAVDGSMDGFQRSFVVEIVIKPYLLDIVEVTDFRTEDVHDDIARVDQDPIATV